MKNFKRITSFFIVLAMLLSLVQPTIFATDTNDTSENRAKLKMVYLGTSDNATTSITGGSFVPTIQDLPTDTSDWESGKIIWVGLALSDMAKMDTTASSGSDGITSHFSAFANDAEWDWATEAGIFNIASAIEYNTDYLTSAWVNASQAKNIGMRALQAADTRYSSYSMDDGNAIAANNGSSGREAEAMTNSASVYTSITATGSTDSKIYGFTDNLNNDDLIISVAAFKLASDGSGGYKVPPAGTKLLQAGLNANYFVIQTGSATDSIWGAQWNVDRTATPDKNLKNHIDYMGDLYLYPAADSVRTLQSIAVKGGTYAIPAQYEGKALDVTGLTIEGTYNLDPTTADIPAADVTYMFGATGITDATDAGLTAVPATLTVADHNGKSLYAVSGGKIVEVGTLSVSAVVIDEVTGVTGAPTGVYADQTVDMSGISATVNKNDGTDGVVIPYADLATNGLAVYKVAGADGSKTYTKVTATDKYVLGNNVFVVGKDVASGTPDFMSPEFTVDAAFDSTTLSASENNAPKVKYAVGNKFDPTGIKVNTKKDTEATATEVAYSGFAAAGLKVVIAADETAALTAGEATADTEITADMIGKKIYVVVDNNGTKSVLEVGAIADRAIESATASGITADAKTYGDKLGDGVSLTVKYDNGDADETINYADFGTKNVTMKIGDTAVDKDTVLTPDMSGKTVDFYVNGVKVASSVALTVNKKAVNVVITTSAPEKVYDGTTTVEEADVTALDVAINADNLESADSALASKIGVTGLTFTYADKNVGTDKVINYAGTAAAVKIGDGADADVTTFNSKYTLVLGPSFDNGALVSPKGIITAKTLNVTAITGVPTVEVGAETLTGSGTLALATTNSDIISGENVTLTYDYAYANADAAGEVDVTITNGAISGADAANYTLGIVPSPVKGEVTNKKLASVTVVAPTKTEYTYPDTKLDLTGMKINLNYEGASAPTEMDVADFIADGGIISLTDATGQAVTVTADNMTDTITLPYGETTITIAYGGKEATQKVTASKKKVSLADITFDASKVYGNDTVTGTYTVADGVIEAGDAVTVEATYTFTEDPETAGENKEVKVTDIKLVGDAAVNYELDGTETTINTGIVSQGTQVAPAAPTVTVDPKTNNLVITGPIGENIEYSIDGGQTWVTDTTFKDLGNGKTVTVQARVKATEDGNLAASDASTAEAKTLKYHVVVLKAKSTTETVIKEIYTDDISKPTKDSEVNTMIFDKKPSGFKAYFSDADAKIAQTYPLKADGNGEVVLYMTKATGGGGGGTQTYKVTYNVGENGTIAEDAKKSESVNSGANPKSVPTVTAKEGYKFVGWSQDGTTVVDPLTVKITKATTFTALYETAVEETPVPTVEPTQEPVDNEPIINVNYTAPYASGYEDASFRPENNITRAELAAMIARLSYGGDLPDGMYDSSFPDVADDAWYNKYIAYLEDKNVLSGYEDGTFRPTNTITRGEISAVIARAQRYEVLPYSGMFADVTDYDWAKDYIETLAVKNIVTGYEDGTFGPYSPLTRAEAVAIINRVLAPSTPVVTFTPNDIAGHWAEADIILAVNERIVNGTEVVEPEATEAPAEEVTEEVAEETTDETVEGAEATEEVTENTEDAANVAPEGVEGTEITTETEETTEVPAE